jgi:hypothetical protein
MRPFTSTIAALALCGAVPAASAQTLKADYSISLAGLSLGTADLSATLEGQKYSMQVGAKLTGLAGALVGGKGVATATGAVGGEKPSPATFAVSSQSSSEQRTVRMGLQGGTVAAVELNPPLDDRPDRVPIKDSHKRGILDPVSALLMPAAAKGDPTDPANCNRTLPIFDGAARFDVVLSYGETRQVEKPGYKGPVLVCNARYVPVAGHRETRSSIKFMAENRDMNVWLAPVEGSRLLMPLRISVRTTMGTSVIEANRWALQGSVPGVGSAAKASATR